MTGEPLSNPEIRVSALANLSPDSQGVVTTTDATIHKDPVRANTVIQHLLEGGAPHELDIAAQECASGILALLSVTNNGKLLEFDDGADPYFKTDLQRKLTAEARRTHGDAATFAYWRVGLGVLFCYTNYVRDRLEVTNDNPAPVA